MNKATFINFDATTGKYYAVRNAKLIATNCSTVEQAQQALNTSQSWVPTFASIAGVVGLLAGYYNLIV